jgi:regulator of nucleoside diphosphate kinase
MQTSDLSNLPDLSDLSGHATPAPLERADEPRRPIVVTELDRRRLLGLIDVLRERAVDAASLDSLELELERAETVDPREVPPDVVTMSSTVELVDLDTGGRSTLTLVFPGRADASEGRVSILAPVGLALLGARVGARVEWRSPSRRKRALVERLPFQPEARGLFHL